MSALTVGRRLRSASPPIQPVRSKLQRHRHQRDRWRCLSTGFHPIEMAVVRGFTGAGELQGDRLASEPSKDLVVATRSRLHRSGLEVPSFAMLMAILSGLALSLLPAVRKEHNARVRFHENLSDQWRSKVALT